MTTQPWPTGSGRPRVLYAALLLAVMASGLGVRRFSGSLPPFVAAYAGDALWALLVFLGVAVLAPARPTDRVAAWAALFCAAIELSQLYQAPWIDAIRHARLGGLILGYEFLWSDLLCYGAGILTGVLAERLAPMIRRRPAATPLRP